MFGWCKTGLMIASTTLAMRVLAQAPTPTTAAFDGTYVGVSNTFEGSAIDGRMWTRYCPQFGPPGTLTIVNGIARAGKIEGSVSPQGLLVMRDFWEPL
jgi:hypothetical protein